MVHPTWLSGVPLILHLGAALAGDLPGDPYVGREIAEDWCGECHKVEPGVVETQRGVPALQAVADDPAFTEMALRAFLRTSHGDGSIGNFV